ncbi:MAG TPA: NDP-sugar synthase [Acidobacteriota bacterium]|nr:NDP-sugar synthase [Acidobacteriota bacterium]
MKALLLAAGLGTRLKPFTFSCAKAALPLLDLPFIHYPLQYLRAQGISEVVINLHAHPDTVRSAAGAACVDMKIHYSHEPEILGTAGALWKAKDLLGEDPFVVLNGDMLCDIPLPEMLRRHQEFNSLVTLAIMDSNSFPNYSGLYFQDTQPPRLAGLQGPGKKWHYTGVQIVSPDVIQRIPPNRRSEIFKDVYPDLMASGRIAGFSYSGMWREIGSLKEYLQTSLDLIENPLPEHLRPAKMSCRTISTKATVENGAVVEESIVMAGAVIRSGATVRRSIVGHDVVVTHDATGVALARGITPWWIQP